nr:hypothetical protein [Tanacetum cinerariifolium]
EPPSKKKTAKVKKVAATKPKPAKKNASVKADRGKGLNVFYEVALSEADQIKKAIERSKKDSHASHPSGSGTDEGTSTIPGVPDVPKYDYESDKESWGNSKEEDNDNDEGTNDGDDEDSNDDDDSDSDDNDDKEKMDDEEKMDEEEYDEVTKELYKDVNVNLGNKDAEMTNAEQGGADQQNVSQESVYEQKSAQHTVQVMAIPEITSISTITVPPPPPFFNALQQQATPTPTPMTFEPTTSFPTLLDFSSVFKFNERVTNLEHNLSEMKQVNQYAQALSFIPAIVDCHIDNKLGEAIQSLINLIDSMVTDILKKDKIEARTDKTEYEIEKREKSKSTKSTKVKVKDGTKTEEMLNGPTLDEQCCNLNRTGKVPWPIYIFDPP